MEPAGAGEQLPSIDYATPPPALPRPSIATVVATLLTMLFLLAFGATAGVAMLLALSHATERSILQLVALVAFNGVTCLVYLSVAALMTDTILRALRGLPERPPPQWTQSPRFERISTPIAGIIRIAVATWGVVLGYLILATLNFRLLPWWEAYLPWPPPLVTQILSGILGTLFWMVGVVMLLAELRQLWARLTGTVGRKSRG